MNEVLRIIVDFLLLIVGTSLVGLAFLIGALIARRAIIYFHNEE